VQLENAGTLEMDEAFAKRNVSYNEYTSKARERVRRGKS